MKKHGLTILLQMCILITASASVIHWLEPETCAMEQPFNVVLFKKRLSTAWLGSEFIHLDQVDSTNSRLKKIPSSSLVHGTVLHTDHQTHGRGQYNRQWTTSPCKNLTFTIAFRPPTAERISLLTLACVSAVSGILEKYTPDPVRLKWPNDLIINDRKIGGILTECIFLGNKTDRVLTGIGLNIFEDNFNSELKDSAVSLASCCKEEKNISRETLLAECLSAIEQAYTRWHKQDQDLPRQISRKLIGYGNWVQLEKEKSTLPGLYKFLGINGRGELVALNEDLDVNTFTHEQIRIFNDSKEVF